MRHKIIIIMPSRPSQLRFSAESVSSELSRPTRDSDSSRSGPRRIRRGRLVSDSAASLNRAIVGCSVVVCGEGGRPGLGGAHAEEEEEEKKMMD